VIFGRRRRVSRSSRDPYRGAPTKPDSLPGSTGLLVSVVAFRNQYMVTDKVGQSGALRGDSGRVGNLQEEACSRARILL
jgi:hypothetical protein